MHSIETIKHLNRRKRLNDDEDDAKRTLELAGFKVETEWTAPPSFPEGEYVFHTITPEGVKIGPMNDREVFWMLEGYKAGKK